MLINREILLAKTESSYGVDASPTAGTDAMLVENLAWSNEGLRMNERPAVRASFGKLKQIYGGTLKTITFDCELKGSGTAGTPPEIAPLLRACGLGETIVPATSVTYNPVSALVESVTIYYYQDGILYKLLGARGNVVFNLETGALGKVSFTFTGHEVDPVDDPLPTAAYNGTVPGALISVPFSIGGFSAIINALTMDMGNTLAQPPDMGASDGYSIIHLTGRDVNGSYDPEATLTAVDNPHSDLKSGSELVLSTGVIGSVAGNRYQLSADKTTYRDQSPGDRDGIRTYEIPFGCAETTTDDDMALQFT
jgi:hypothetical protein